MVLILFVMLALMLGIYRVICCTLVAWEVSALVKYIGANW